MFVNSFQLYREILVADTSFLNNCQELQRFDPGPWVFLSPWKLVVTAWKYFWLPTLDVLGAKVLGQAYHMADPIWHSAFCVSQVSKAMHGSVELFCFVFFSYALSSGFSQGHPYHNLSGENSGN